MMSAWSRGVPLASVRKKRAIIVAVTARHILGGLYLALQWTTELLHVFCPQTRFAQSLKFI